MKNPESKKIIDISAFQITVGEDEIVRANVKDHVTVDLKSAIEITDTLRKISPDSPRPLLIHLGKISYISKEARDHFGEKRQPTASAIALIAKTSLSMFIGNFYLHMNKPSLPTRLFKGEQKAIRWLKKFVTTQQRYVFNI